MDCNPIILAGFPTGESPHPWPEGRPAVTRHARARQPQRVIPEVVIEGLLDFGQSRRTPAGKAWRRRSGWRRFSAFLGPEARHFKRHRRASVVTSADGAILTVAWD